MILVGVIAVSLGLGLPACEVWREREPHGHTWPFRSDEPLNGPDGPDLVLGPGAYGFVEAPFWPRYRLRLLGKPWKDLPLCGRRKRHRGEACQFDEPVFAQTIE